MLLRLSEMEREGGGGKKHFLLIQIFGEVIG